MSSGKLRPPQYLPLLSKETIPPPASVELDLFAEKESLFEPAAKDPRAAIKRSWELLAKDILCDGQTRTHLADIHVEDRGVVLTSNFICFYCPDAHRTKRESVFGDERITVCTSYSR